MTFNVLILGNITCVITGAPGALVPGLLFVGFNWGQAYFALKRGRTSATSWSCGWWSPSWDRAPLARSVGWPCASARWSCERPPERAEWSLRHAPGRQRRTLEPWP